ncbi:hypothetical protein [Yinghuangia seranimata]|uniref:hypothetical protein n=1 Tax=Yinghuangia seranimata TaxID=408067 RepID=UPI00248BFCC0|nr:hypothetical protein [Yinghuangia seranimata]MDI2129950.1 hypothetical protein [Yinghuangia seranimata]MDI2131628.1 hypothetical protein [Yinghuangia seranimata]
MKIDGGGPVSVAELLLGHADAATAERARVRLGLSVGAAEAGSGADGSSGGASARSAAAASDGAAAVSGGAVGPDPDGTPLAVRLRNPKGRVDSTALDGYARADWDLVAEEHLRSAFDDEVARQLVVHPDCPRDAVLVLATESPFSVTARHGRAFSVALDRRLLTARQLAFEGRPAWRALGTVARVARPAYDQPRFAPLDRIVDEAARMLPGPDPAAWAWLVRHAPNYPGTFPELCAEAARAADPGRADAGAVDGASLVWSDPPDPADPRRNPQRWGRMSPLGLLGRLPPEDAAAVLAVLPSDVCAQLRRVNEPLPGHLVLTLMRDPELDARGLVRRMIPDRDTEAVLLARHDRHINAALLAESKDAATRHAVFAASRRDASPRVRLTPHSRGWLNLQYRDGCPEAVYGHHVAFLRTVLRRGTHDLSPAAVLRGLLSLWEAQGRGALLDPRLRSLLRGTPATWRALHWACNAADGLARLRAEVERLEQPDALVAAVREHPAMAGGYLPAAFWPAAVTAHADEPLRRRLLAALARHPDCPAELVRDAVRTDGDLAVELAGRSREYALAALAEPLGPPPRWANAGRGGIGDWIGNALADDVVSVREFVERAHPATRAVEATGALSGVLPESYAEALEAVVAEHARAALGDDAEAWAVAVMLLPEFVGTLPELFATAASAARS